jgi:hypothetical protein
MLFNQCPGFGSGRSILSWPTGSGSVILNYGSANPDRRKNPYQFCSRKQFFNILWFLCHARVHKTLYICRLLW